WKYAKFLRNVPNAVEALFDRGDAPEVERRAVAEAVAALDAAGIAYVGDADQRTAAAPRRRRCASRGPAGRPHRGGVPGHAQRALSAPRHASLDVADLQAGARQRPRRQIAWPHAEQLPAGADQRRREAGADRPRRKVLIAFGFEYHELGRARLRAEQLAGRVELPLGGCANSEIKGRRVDAA